MKTIITILLLTVAVTSYAQSSKTKAHHADTVVLTAGALEQLKTFEARGEELKKAQEQLQKDSQLFLVTFLDAKGRPLTDADSLTFIQPDRFVIHKRKRGNSFTK